MAEDWDNICCLLSSTRTAIGRGDYKVALIGNEFAYKNIYRLWENETDAGRKGELNKVLESLMNQDSMLAELT